MGASGTPRRERGVLPGPSILCHRGRDLRDNDRIAFTKTQGMYGPVIADHVFSLLLALMRDLRHLLDDEQRGRRDRGGSEAPRIALWGCTAFVAGLGGIGGETAERGKGFSMRVPAWSHGRRLAARHQPGSARAVPKEP